MRNFLEETLEAITDSGHTPADIIFIGSEDSGHECTWEEFTKLANFHYDNGFGTAKIAQDLHIVFSDGKKMWRGEYDGSEWWEYSQPFNRPENKLPISRLVLPPGCWGLYTLGDINDPEALKELEETNARGPSQRA